MARREIDEAAQIKEDLNMAPGLGATMSNGRDSYPYYVSEVLPNKVIGMYSPGSHFAKDWTDGHEVVDKYDPNHPTEFYIKRAYGKWWNVSKDGKKRLSRFTGRYRHLSFGHASAYSDPSF